MAAVVVSLLLLLLLLAGALVEVSAGLGVLTTHLALLLTQTFVVDCVLCPLNLLGRFLLFQFQLESGVFFPWYGGLCQCPSYARTSCHDFIEREMSRCLL